MNNYKMLIDHDQHGDVIGLSFFENGILKAKHGWGVGYPPTIVERNGYYGGPLNVVYNTLLEANNLLDSFPQKEAPLGV